jgi:hypothetical protein
LTRLSLLRLLLLFDLLLCDIFAILPLDLRALALFNHVLALHGETLGKLLVLEVVVLLESEDKVETIAGVVKLAVNILQVHKDGSILFLNEARDTAMVEH